MNCTRKVTANIAYDCGANRPKAGLETTAVLINREDIDLTALTSSAATVTNLSLVSGATGYSIDWIKNLGSAAADFVANENGVNYFSNKFVCRVFGQSAEDAERVKELSTAELVVVVQTKYKGENNAAAYSIFGIDSGLMMSEGTYSTLENDGSFVFTISSPDGFGEEYHKRTLLMTDYATTKTAFDSLFA